jgi:putative tryptophan/tyrosine transport system substrate-binding protein
LPASLAGGAGARPDHPIRRRENPGETPFSLVDKYEFIINLKTAKALGLEIPATLLVRADEVLE